MTAGFMRWCGSRRASVVERAATIAWLAVIFSVHGDRPEYGRQLVWINKCATYILKGIKMF